jgi:ribosomal protein S12 methylthiotransferase
MSLQKKIVQRKLARRIGERVEVLVDGPSPEHELVLQGRLAGQAPEIDPVVFLTEGDPESMQAGDFVWGEIVDAKGYDLVVRVD